MVSRSSSFLQLGAVLLMTLAGCDISTTVIATETDSSAEIDALAAQSTSPSVSATEQIDPLSMAPEEWVFLASMQISRSEYSIAAIDGQIYAPGGLAGGYPATPSNALERYDPATNTWVHLAILPRARDHAMAAAWDGKLYFFGGGDITSRGPNAWVYDPQTDSWQTIAVMPFRVAAGAAITLDDYIYVIGGLADPFAEDPYAGEVLRYSPQTDEWDILAALPVNLNHCAVVAVDGEIYVLGGRTGSQDYNIVQIYNPAGDSWREGAPFQQARAGHAAVVVDGLIYLLGGERMNSEDNSVLDSVEIFDPSTQSWSFGVPMPVALHGVPAVAIQDTIFVVGGSELVAGVENHGYLLAFRP